MIYVYKIIKEINTVWGEGERLYVDSGIVCTPPKQQQQQQQQVVQVQQ